MQKHSACMTWHSQEHTEGQARSTTATFRNILVPNAVVVSISGTWHSEELSEGDPDLADASQLPVYVSCIGTHLQDILQIRHHAEERSLEGAGACGSDLQNICICQWRELVQASRVHHQRPPCPQPLHTVQKGPAGCFQQRRDAASWERTWLVEGWWALPCCQGVSAPTKHRGLVSRGHPGDLKRAFKKCIHGSVCMYLMQEHTSLVSSPQRA